MEVKTKITFYNDIEEVKVFDHEYNLIEVDFDNNGCITLDEIKDQVNLDFITVWYEAPLNGAIFRYGNYTDGKWHRIGILQGYA